MKEQLTLNDLCCYLPFDLKFEAPVLIWTGNPPEPSHDEIGQVTMTTSNMEQLINHGTPIFRNLATDLTREITHNGETFVPFEKIKNNHIDFFVDTDFEDYILDRVGEKLWLIIPFLPYGIIQILHSWHFWLGDQSYFEKKIILDYNDVNGL